MDNKKINGIDPEMAQSLNDISLLDFTSKLKGRDATAGFDFVAEIARGFGFVHIHYTRLTTDRVGCRSLVEQSNLPKEWLNQYDRQNLVAYDPVVAAGMRDIVFWSEVGRPERQCRHRGTPDVQGIAQEWGLGSGISVPIASRSDVVSAFGLVNSTDRSESELKSTWCAQATKLIPFLATYDAFCEIGGLSISQTGITDRELAALEVFAAGHTTKEASHLLGKSYHTVEKQITSAKRKLGANTIAQAVARAVAIGII